MANEPKPLKLKWKKRTKGGTIKKTGKKAIVNIYSVHGAEESLKLYKEIRGEYYSEDPKTKEPLFWSRRYLGDTGILQFTQEDEFGERNVYGQDSLDLLAVENIQQQAEMDNDEYLARSASDEKFKRLMGASTMVNQQSSRPNIPTNNVDDEDIVINLNEGNNSEDENTEPKGKASKKKNVKMDDV